MLEAMLVSMEKKRTEVLEAKLFEIETELSKGKSPFGLGNVLELSRKQLWILLQLKKYNKVEQAGFYYVGSEGPDIIIQKLIVLALCLDGKFDFCLEVLRNWTRNYPSTEKDLDKIREVVHPRVQALRTQKFRTPHQAFENMDKDLGFGLKREDNNDTSAAAQSLTLSSLQNFHGIFNLPANTFPRSPRNIAYLNQLIKEYEGSMDRFWTRINGIEMSWSSALNVNTKKPEYAWTVELRSTRKENLRTVSLLLDRDRSYFRISEAFFFGDRPMESSINLIEFNACNHKNASMLQVLSTFIPPTYMGRPQYFYKMSFAFLAHGIGDFAQSIVFDFKEEPRLIQHLSITVEPGSGSVSESRPFNTFGNNTQVNGNTQLDQSIVGHAAQQLNLAFLRPSGFSSLATTGRIGVQALPFSSVGECGLGAGFNNNLCSQSGLGATPYSIHLNGSDTAGIRFESRIHEKPISIPNGEHSDPNYPLTADHGYATMDYYINKLMNELTNVAGSESADTSRASSPQTKLPLDRRAPGSKRCGIPQEPRIQTVVPMTDSKIEPDFLKNSACHFPPLQASLVQGTTKIKLDDNVSARRDGYEWMTVRGKRGLRGCRGRRIVVNDDNDETSTNPAGGERQAAERAMLKEEALRRKEWTVTFVHMGYPEHLVVKAIEAVGLVGDKILEFIEGNNGSK